MTLEIATMDPLIASAACLLGGERFEPEGYQESFAPELLPGVPAYGFAPAVLVDGSPAGFVCPECFGDGKEDLGRSMKRGAGRLRRLASVLEGAV